MSSQPIDLNTIGQSGEIQIHPLQDKVVIVKDEIQKLSAAIEANAPGYKEVLFKIDGILRGYKELTYMLTEEEIGVIIQGLQKDSDIQFITTAKSSGGGKSGKGGKDKIDVQNIDTDI